MPDNFVDTILTDPPYELTGKSGNGGFMGKKWDASGIAFNPEVWREALRVAKPGATLMAFGGTRTYHRLACAIEDAGWEIRDCITYFHDGNQAEAALMASLDEEQLAAYLELHYPNHQMSWIYGSGIGLGYDVSKGIDSVAGKVREVVGIGLHAAHRQSQPYGQGAKQCVTKDTREITTPATPLAAKWDGWKSRLKPAHEPIILAMAPMPGGYAANAEQWGVAGLWIDGGRIEAGDDYLVSGFGPRYGQSSMPSMGGHQTRPWVQEAIKNGKPVKDSKPNTKGRYPANIILDGSETVEAEFAKAGVSFPRKGRSGKRGGNGFGFFDDEKSSNHNGVWPSDNGGTASRYFQHCPPDTEPARLYYCPKAGPKERATPGNDHPTQKPVSLVKYLARLSKTPDGGIVLDPFGGSGTTALACISEGRDYILIEKEPDYAELCRRRIAEYTGQEIEGKEIKLKDEQKVKQLGLW
jgi:site-specific DNA-methyltransferase (adenine-specific)